MAEQPGNTGVAGGTESASRVPSSPASPEPYPEPDSGEQNANYAQPDETGVDDDSKAVG